MDSLGSIPSSRNGRNSEKLFTLSNLCQKNFYVQGGVGKVGENVGGRRRVPLEIGCK